ncbi:MAG: hypothetical protein JW839_15165 [Candidatus Lokiarchaeota archaeon]|nr:hypothetical protein [Candidatus Lokiarchaeota archaeon]
MTHSLHRTGGAAALERDYVVLAMLAKAINDSVPGARERLVKAGSIFKQNGPVNIMMESLWAISPVITAVYDDEARLRRALLELKEADLGISIVVSGLLSGVQAAVHEAGLAVHTVHLSLGTFGKKDELPRAEVLELTTMCGHHCISPASVAAQVDRIRGHGVPVGVAARELAKPCVCGIFNTTRAEALLRRLVDAEGAR